MGKERALCLCQQDAVRGKRSSWTRPWISRQTAFEHRIAAIVCRETFNTSSNAVNKAHAIRGIITLNHALIVVISFAAACLEPRIQRKTGSIASFNALGTAAGVTMSLKTAQHRRI